MSVRRILVKSAIDQMRASSIFTNDAQTCVITERSNSWPLFFFTKNSPVCRPSLSVAATRAPSVSAVNDGSCVAAFRPYFLNDEFEITG